LKDSEPYFQKFPQNNQIRNQELIKEAITSLLFLLLAEEIELTTQEKNRTWWKWTKLARRIGFGHFRQKNPQL
jgi:hypothetical protein